MYVFIQHKVRDFAAWKTVYDQHDEVRRRHGQRSQQVYRSAADPNDVVVVCDFATESGIKAFLADPSLGKAMERGGVTGSPVVVVGSATDIKRT